MSGIVSHLDLLVFLIVDSDSFLSHVGDAVHHSVHLGLLQATLPGQTWVEE